MIKDTLPLTFLKILPLAWNALILSSFHSEAVLNVLSQMSSQGVIKSRAGAAAKWHSGKGRLIGTLRCALILISQIWNHVISAPPQSQNERER